MTKPRLACAMIVGNDVTDDPTDFNRAIFSLVGRGVDILCVIYNGKDYDKFLEIAGESPVPIVHQHREWEEDFSLARNQSFDLVRAISKHNGGSIEWVLWMDSDDSLEKADEVETLWDVIDNANSTAQGIFLRYDYAVDRKTQTVLAVQWRERLLRLDGNWQWFYPIHEICHAPAGVELDRSEMFWTSHWREPRKASPDTRERNRKILMKARKENPEEPRFLYYFANEVYAEAATKHQAGEPANELINAAIKSYEDFIPDAPSPDDAYIAAHQIAELKRMAKANLGAIESELQALMVHPTWPDAYVGIAQCYMEEEDWDKCLFWARAAQKLSAPQETTQVREPLNDYYLPRLLEGIALENKGYLDESLVLYEELKLTGLANDELDFKIERLSEVIEARANTEVVVEKDIRDVNFGLSGEKSIAFFTRPLFEPWHPNVINEGGIGGAETCVIELSKRFADDGYRVVVFGTPGDHRGVDENGIEWYNSSEWSPTEKFTHFVSSRTPEIFDAEIKADTTTLWMHDVNTSDNFQGPWGPRIVEGKPDHVFGLSRWHCNHLARLYNVNREQLALVPNGIDLSRFDRSASGFPVEEHPRQQRKFIWSSSPDRGLDVLVNMWPQIREEWPDAELHVFYGWHSINKILEIQPDHPLINFKIGIEEALDEIGREAGGIYWHDRVGQDRLAQEMMTADMWLYPTYFMETFCITALEAQAAGAIPLVNAIGGMPELIANPVLKVHGWPNNVSFQKQYIERLKTIINLPNDLKASMRNTGRAHASTYTWDNAYKNWQQILGY